MARQLHERIEPRLSRPTPVEKRFGNPWGNGWGAVALGSGGSLQARPSVPWHLAESLSAVVACVELIAGAIVSLPASIVADDGTPAPVTLPAVALIRRPNTRQNWPAFIQQMVAAILMTGNGCAWAQADGRGAIASLTPVPWPWLNPQVVTGASGARLVFDVTVATPASSLLGLPNRFLDTDLLHVRARSDDGIIGRSVLSRAAGVIREGLEIAQLADANWRNGLRPSGVLSSPDWLRDDQVDRAKAILQDYVGAMNAGRVPLLEGAWKWQQLGMNSQDAEFLASRQFSVAEIARLFNVPEPMLQVGTRLPADMAPFVAAFAQLALAPVVSAMESEFAEAVLPAGYRLQMDLGGLLRGNFPSQAASFSTLVQSRIATPNDARSALGLPAHPDGDVLAASAAPSFPADAAGMPSLAPKPGPTGSGLPDPGTHGNEGAG